MTRDERVRLDKIIEELGTIRGQLDTINSTIKRHDKTLFGNGQPGLVEKVAKIEQSRKTVFLILGVVNALIGTLCGLASAFFAWR